MERGFPVMDNAGRLVYFARVFVASGVADFLDI
jgi:hypothetical protein